MNSIMQKKYTIEDNIDFYKELNTDTESCNYDNVCQITGSPLIDKSVMLECKHTFNYDAIYTEICRQKFDFQTYSLNLLTKQDYHKVIQSKLDYFIRCPYCRNIQFTTLPHYPELKLQEHYGINSLDKIIHKYGVSFKVGKCCHSAYICPEIYVASNPKSNICYCTHHYVEEIKKQRLNEKQALLKKKEADKAKKTEELTKKKDAIIKKKEDIAKKKEDIIKKKEEELTLKNKLLEETNVIRVSNGLTLLKRLPIAKIHKHVVNV